MVDDLLTDRGDRKVVGGVRVTAPQLNKQVQEALAASTAAAMAARSVGHSVVTVRLEHLALIVADRARMHELLRLRGQAAFRAQVISDLADQVRDARLNSDPEVPGDELFEQWLRGQI